MLPGPCPSPRRLDRRGFTLVELILVLSIIFVLSGIAIYNMRSADTGAYVATMESDLRYLALAQEEYYSEFDGYANAIAVLDYHASPGVAIALQVDAMGWSAVATHAQRSSDRTFCAIFYGDVPPVFPATLEGAPGCTTS